MMQATKVGKLPGAWAQRFPAKADGDIGLVKTPRDEERNVEPSVAGRSKFST